MHISVDIEPEIHIKFQPRLCEFLNVTKGVRVQDERGQIVTRGGVKENRFFERRTF